MDVEARSGAAKTTLRHNVRNLPPAAWILVAGAFINRLASFAAVFLILFLRDDGFSVVRAGSVVAAYGVGELAGSALGGWLADRIGRRSTIVLSLYASAAAVLGLSRVGSLAVAIGVAFLAGVVFEAHRPAALALMADIVPPEGLVTAYAVLRLAANLGFAIGSVVAGFLATRSFVWIFVTDAATSVIFATIALTALPQGRVSRREQEPAAAAIHTAGADRAFLAVLFASVMVAFVFSQSQSTLPLEVVSRPGLTTQTYGWLLAMNSVIVVLFELPISAWTMHRPPRLMIALGSALVGLGFGLTTLATSLPALAGTVAVWTLGGDGRPPDRRRLRGPPGPRPPGRALPGSLRHGPFGGRDLRAGPGLDPVRGQPGRPVGPVRGTRRLRRADPAHVERPPSDRPRGDARADPRAGERPARRPHRTLIERLQPPGSLTHPGAGCIVSIYQLDISNR